MSAGYYRVGQYYVDTTNNALYRCTTAGDKSSSVWVQISSSGSGAVYEAYNNSHAYAVGSIVWQDTTTTISGITILPGYYLCIAAVSASGTANKIPQFPLPGGTVYWRFLAPTPQLINICTSSGTQSVYIPSTAAF